MLAIYAMLNKSTFSTNKSKHCAANEESIRIPIKLTFR